MLGLADKVGVVTGSTDAIGRAIALKLAGEGVTVVVNGRTPAKSRAVIDQIVQRGGEASYLQADVSDYEQMVGLVEQTVDRYGRIDIMIASTGGARRAAPPSGSGRYFHQTQVSELASAAADYVTNRLNPIRAALNHMIEQKSGSMVMLASEGGRFPTAGQVGIALGSGGLVMATKTIAKEIVRWHIRLNTISISLTEDTPIKRSHDAQAEAGDHNRTKYFDKVIARAPLGLAKPSDIAELAAFLVSDGARMLTGTTISPTGGLTFPS